MLKSGLYLIRTKYKRVALFFTAVAMVVSLGLSLTQSPVANAQPPNPGASFGENISTCSIQQVGWVICPVMRTIAQLADYGFGFINENFLRIEYNLTGGDSGIYIAWELIRNIANVVLVLAFLYIVYTQITGRNTGDYNLKRILPRLIIGAILLNVSYYICAAAIQLSNIVGSAVISIMVEVADRIGTPAMSLSAAADGFEDGILTDLVTAMLQEQGTAWVMMAPMATITIAIATVSAAALVLLIARKVVVSMLVLVSPLLFVAYLLPNLERFFQQWVRLFIQLLLLYPVVAFLLGTGQIVSATIISVGTNGDSDYRIQGDGYASKTGGSGSATTDLAAAGAAVLPLIGVWWMMKGLSAVMSSAGTKLTAGIGRGGKARERAERLQAKAKTPTPSTANNINITGGKVNVFDKKPAFTRRRRTPGASIASAAQQQKAGQASRAGGAFPPGSALNGALGATLGQSDLKSPEEAKLEAAKRAEEINAANISADEATAAGVQAMSAQAQGDDKKKSGANDLFKSLNQRQKPQSPDAQRQFGTAMPPAGGGGQAGGTPATGGSSDHRAPQTMQPISAPQGAPQRIVAVPVQINPSTLAGGGAPQPRTTAMPQPPTTQLQQKAKGIANKYLYDSARDVDEATRQMEDLTKKNDDNNPDALKG